MRERENVVLTFSFVKEYVRVYIYIFVVAAVREKKRHTYTW